jgi:predicted enzyme related to lactoylglutathione lyase
VIDRGPMSPGRERCLDDGPGSAVSPEKDVTMASWPSGISAITLFVEDLPAAKRFYGLAFGLPIMFEDDASAVFHFRNALINLLKASSAPELIEPAVVAPPEAGSRMQFTIDVDEWTRCAPT